LSGNESANNNIIDINLIVGKNGSVKTDLFEFLLIEIVALFMIFPRLSLFFDVDYAPFAAKLKKHKALTTSFKNRHDIWCSYSVSV